MPYEIRGSYVYNKQTGERKNKRPLGRERAVRYMRALYAAESRSKEAPLLHLLEALKANYGAKRGEVIAGNLMRGEGGQFTSAGQSVSPKKPPTAKKPTAKKPTKPKRRAGGKKRVAARRGGKGRAAPKPKKTDAQRAQERQARQAERQQETAQQQAKNRTSVIDQMAESDQGLAPAGAKALLDFADGKPLSEQAAQALSKMGMVTQDAQGNYRLTIEGRTFAAAADSGDFRRAVDAVSKGADRVSAEAKRGQEREGKRAEAEAKRQARAAEQAQKKTEREAKRAELEKRRGGKGGGGGGGGKPKKPEEKKPEPKKPEPKKLEPKKPELKKPEPKKPELKKPEPEERAALREQVQAQERQQNRAGIVDQMEATDQGLNRRTATALLAFADGQAADPGRLDVLSQVGLLAKDSQGGYRLSAEGKAFVGAADKGDIRGALDAVSKGGDRVADETRRTQERTQRETERTTRQSQREAEKKQRETERQARKKSFTVYKDRQGRHRWLMVSSTAFRDRDGEIVSTKALEDDVARSDASGLYGPLRWWHIPGLELGDCDYRTVDGRSLIESGTFRDERIGRAVAQKADQYQASLGFIHPFTEPDDNGIFHSIQTFERSLVPRGRAANPLTRLVVKETTMLTPEKEAKLKELLGDEDDLLDALLSQVHQTEKDAEERGVAFKEGAPPEMKDDMLMAEEDGAALVEEESPEEDAGPLFTPEELDLIADAVVAKIAPLFQVEQKMRGYFDELKSAFGGHVAQKDASEAELREQLQQAQASVASAQQAQRQLEARLKELEGDQPTGPRGYRATQDPATVRPEARLKELETPQPDSIFGFFSDVVPGARQG